MGLCVLIVDDEPLLAEEAACGLELAGFPVITTGSSADAQALLASRADIGLLLTDIRMPREDGLTLARRAQSGRPADRALGVILMTGHGTVEPEPGIDACVPKPFAIDDMVTLVGGLLQQVEARRRDAA